MLFWPETCKAKWCGYDQDACWFISFQLTTPSISRSLQLFVQLTAQLPLSAINRHSSKHLTSTLAIQKAESGFYSDDYKYCHLLSQRSQSVFICTTELYPSAHWPMSFVLPFVFPPTLLLFAVDFSVFRIKTVTAGNLKRGTVWTYPFRNWRAGDMKTDLDLLKSTFQDRNGNMPGHPAYQFHSPFIHAQLWPLLTRSSDIHLSQQQQHMLKFHSR